MKISDDAKNSWGMFGIGFLAGFVAAVLFIVG